MKKYSLEGGTVYHNHCDDDKGICDFTTSNDGITVVKCRQCGDFSSVSEFVYSVER